MTATSCTIESPVGPLTITAEDGAVTAVDFGGGGGPRPNTGVLTEAARQLTEYFAGDRREFALPLTPQGTPFPPPGVGGDAGHSLWRNPELR